MWEGQLSAQFKALLECLRSDRVALDKRIEECDQLIERHVQQDPAARRLLQIPGIGPKSAAAPAWAMLARSSAGATGPLGLGLCHVSTVAGIDGIFWASPNEATNTCAVCLYTVRARRTVSQPLDHSAFEPCP
jgi:hypothetical protein